MTTNAFGVLLDSSNTASTIVYRDTDGSFSANAITGRNFVQRITSTVSSGGTTNLGSNATERQILTGTLNQTYRLPNATQITTGWVYIFNNNSTGTLTVTDFGANTLTTIPAGGMTRFSLTDNSTSNGVWDYHSYTPSNVQWGTSTLTYPGTIASATWNGSLITGTYGGTGVNNGASTITIGGNVTFSGAFTFTGTITGNTSVTFPTSGTLATTAGTVASITGTANQVLANSTSGSAQTGAVTLTLPQDIATTSTPSFGGLTISGTGARGASITSSTTGGSASCTFDLKRADINSGNLHRFYTGVSLNYQLGSSAGTSDFTLQDGSGTYLLTVSSLGELFLPSYTNHSVLYTTTGGLINAVSGTTGQVLIFGATDPVFGAVNLASASAVTGTLPVANGGTGQTTYTDGQLLIGNTTGNTLTKATLTGTSNQVVVTNGSGSITLSLPQSIATSSSPTFQGLILSGYTFSGTSALIDCQTNLTGNYLRLGTGGANIGISNSSGTPVFISRNLNFDATAASYKYNASAAASLIEVANGVGYLKYAASGTAGNTVTPSTALTWDTNADITISAGNAIINTAGKTLKVKQGSNACFGTGAVLVGGTVTVSTTAVATGDTIFLSCTAAGGTQGIPRISAISNGTSFTITSSSGTDTSTYSWLIIKAA